MDDAFKVFLVVEVILVNSDDVAEFFGALANEQLVDPKGVRAGV